MEDTKIEEKSEIQPTDLPIQQSGSKSSFNNAEYERWSEYLRSRGNSKDK